jgi:hypothetical protein
MANHRSQVRRLREQVENRAPNNSMLRLTETSSEGWAMTSSLRDDQEQPAA